MNCFIQSHQQKHIGKTTTYISKHSPGEFESSYGWGQERVAVGLGATGPSSHHHSLVLRPDLHTVKERNWEEGKEVMAELIENKQHVR